DRSQAHDGTGPGRRAARPAGAVARQCQEVTAMDAKERLLAALADRPRGLSKMSGVRAGPAGLIPVESKALVTVVAADIVEGLGQARGDAITEGLRQGCMAGQPQRAVTVYSDDLWHVLDAAGGSPGKRKGGG